MTTTTDQPAAPDTPPAPPRPPRDSSPPPGLLRQLAGRYVGPTDIAGQQRWAKSLASAKHGVPVEYRGDAGALVALMAHAISLDIPLPVAWQNLVFNPDGKGGMTGILMHGLIIRAGHSIIPLHADDKRCTLLLRRGDGQPSGQATWTLAQAAAASLLLKDNWQCYQSDMLWWRAMGRVCRRYASDVVMGLGYLPDELDHTDEMDRPDEVIDLSEVDADGNIVPAPDVVKFLDGVAELTWPQIRKKFEKAHDGGLLGAYAGVVDGAVVTVETVLFNAGEAARKREAADRAAAGQPDPDDPPAPAAATPQPDPRPADVPVADVPGMAQATAGNDGERMGCPGRCRTAVVVATGDHEQGCPQYQGPWNGPKTEEDTPR